MVYFDCIWLDSVAFGRFRSVLVDFAPFDRLRLISVDFDRFFVDFGRFRSFNQFLLFPHICKSRQFFPKVTLAGSICTWYAFTILSVVIYRTCLNHGGGGMSVVACMRLMSQLQLGRD